MFRRTNPQGTLGSLSVLLSPKKIDRLERKHWAGGFRRKALPVLLAGEETFRPLFCEDSGRLRVRGSPAVSRTVSFKFMALNVSRWIRPARKTRISAA